MDIRENYVKEHNIVSVPVSDIDQIIDDAVIMFKLCHTGIGFYPGARAIAHSQINDKEPLRFFVLHNGRIIVNPIIIELNGTVVDHEEGCMTFPESKTITVKRNNKIVVEYQEVEHDKLTEKKVSKYGGMLAKIFQHEIDHFNGIYIYNK